MEGGDVPAQWSLRPGEEPSVATATDRIRVQVSLSVSDDLGGVWLSEGVCVCVCVHACDGGGSTCVWFPRRLYWEEPYPCVSGVSGVVGGRMEERLYLRLCRASCGGEVFRRADKVPRQKEVFLLRPLTSKQGEKR